MTVTKNDLSAFLEHDLRPYISQFARWHLIDGLAAMLSCELQSITDGATGRPLSELRNLRVSCEINMNEAMDEAVNAVLSLIEEGPI